MEPTKLIRTLLVAMWATGIGSGAVEFALESTLPKPLQEWMAESVDEDPTPAQMAGLGLAMASIALFVWATVLLWQLNPLGARVLLTSLVFILLAMPLLGPVVSTAWGSLLGEVSTVLGGAILGWFYLAKVPFERAAVNDAEFDRELPPPPPPPPA